VTKWFDGCILLLSALLLPGAPPEQFDSYAVSTVMAPMRDGVQLATDVYRPTRAGTPVEGKFPVLLYRTPYNKSGQRQDGAYFAQRGYVVLSQDCRGRFASQGEFYAFVNEGKDGFDAIEWAASQPWSNGKVGTIGASYLAWDQYHAAMYRPPHLVAMFALVGGANFYQEYGYPGGVPNLSWPLWILRSAESSPQGLRDSAAAQPLRELLKIGPAPWLALHPQNRAEILRKFPAHLKMYQDFLDHPEFDAEWRQQGFYTKGYYKLMKDVPVFFVTGWYDYFAEGVLENFSALSRLQKSPKMLLVGPWPHGTGLAECGDAAFGPDAARDQRALALDWFDHWMKGQPFEKIGAEAVQLFRMGGGDGSRTAAGRFKHGGAWRAASSWPLPGSRISKHYIHAEGALNQTPPAQENPSTFLFDPERPVATIGGRYGLGAWTPNCAQDQVCSPKILGCEDSSPLNRRADVLSFSTGPLESPVEVTGKIRAALWISSDQPDTDFTAKLMDVYPNGYALILADGQIRARYRSSFEKPELMKPRAVYMVAIDLGSTSNLFSTGHRIRLDISSSNYPKFEPNPNTGEPVNRWSRRVKAQNTVYHDARRPSYVELPLR